MLPYEKKNITLAKNLRKNMTPWERKLWFLFLRNYPVRFQRQKAIENYVVDFYCASKKLVIELDGGGHYTPEAQKQDAERTAVLNGLNLRVLRFSNRDIDHNFEGVCTAIHMAVQQGGKQ